MQPARIKLHAKEHTNNPVQRPNFRGHAAGDVDFGTGWPLMAEQFTLFWISGSRCHRVWCKTLWHRQLRRLGQNQVLIQRKVDG